MAIAVPNGSIVSIANGYGTAVAITAISNANPAVATAAGHTFVEGDYVEVTSGFSRLTNKVVRVGATTSTTFALDGINTTNTSIYPAGAGAGSARDVAGTGDGFTQLAQITDSSSSGGEQQFLEYQFLEDDAQKRIPTFKNAAGIAFTVADDPTLPGYIVAAAANDDRLARAVRIRLSNGSELLYNAYVSIGTIPTLTVNQLMTVQVTLSLLAEPVRYAAA